MMSKLVAIHQPNFFPWLGYFDKIRMADVFIFLDAVDYPRAGSSGMGSWTNRVHINVQDSARWLTCPVQRMPLGTKIKEVLIDNSNDWRTKFRKTMAACYGRAPGYARGMEIIGSRLDTSPYKLAEFNIGTVMRIASELGLKTTFVRQSDVVHEGKGTDLLVSLVKAVEGTAYLAGGGASAYQLDELFAANSLKLVYQGFQPRPYGSPRTFIPRLSVIDFLMRVDPDRWSVA